MRKELGHLMITAQLSKGPPALLQAGVRAAVWSNAAAGVITSSHHHTARPGPGPGEMMGSQGEVMIREFRLSLVLSNPRLWAEAIVAPCLLPRWSAVLSVPVQGSA